MTNRGDTRVWLITGASSGFGRAIAEAALGGLTETLRDEVAAFGIRTLQAGDPAKAAQAILAALDADEPPLRLTLGADAIATIERRGKSISDELDAWRAVGEATAVDEP